MYITLAVECRPAHYESKMIPRDHKIEIKFVFILVINHLCTIFRLNSLSGFCVGEEQTSIHLTCVFIILVGGSTRAIFSHAYSIGDIILQVLVTAGTDQASL